MELSSTTEDCLNRAHFGACLVDDQIFFFGGCKIESGEFVNLPISQLFCINLETKMSQVFILSMPSPYQGLEIANFAYAVRPGCCEIWVSGGSINAETLYTADNLEKSSSVFILNYQHLALTKLDIISGMQAKLGVSAASMFFYNSNTAIVWGGGEPVQGSGTRACLLLTAEDVKMEKCKSDQNCVIETHYHIESRMVECTNSFCQGWYHIVCCEDLRKLKTVPDKWICSLCKPKPKRGRKKVK